MPEFSRRVDFHIFKDEPKSRDEWLVTATLSAGQLLALDDTDPQAAIDTLYRQYLESFQPYRWHAVPPNNKIISDGESYFNEADCINAIELLGGDDTTAYYVREYGEDRGIQWLRYGVTDRNNQAAQS